MASNTKSLPMSGVNCGGCHIQFGSAEIKTALVLNGKHYHSSCYGKAVRGEALLRPTSAIKTPLEAVDYSFVN